MAAATERSAWLVALVVTMLAGPALAAGPSPDLSTVCVDGLESVACVEARIEWSFACAQDDASACGQLASFLQTGCESGDPASCVAWARAMDDLNLGGRRGRPRSRRSVRKAMRAACKAGHSSSCAELRSTTPNVVEEVASIFVRGRLELRMGRRPLAALLTACDDGDAMACADRAREVHRGKRISGRRAALAAAVEACQGWPDACVAPGQLTFLQDRPAGLALLQRGCEGRSYGSCQALERHGLFAFEEHGEPLGLAFAGDASSAFGRPEEAAARWKQACEAKVGHGCAGYGAALLGGVGVTRDVEAASGALWDACVYGGADDCRTLADYAITLPRRQQLRVPLRAYRMACWKKTPADPESCDLYWKLLADTDERCRAGAGYLCWDLAIMAVNQYWVDLEGDRFEVRNEYYQLGCEGGHPQSCHWATTEATRSSEADRRADQREGRTTPSPEAREAEAESAQAGATACAAGTKLGCQGLESECQDGSQAACRSLARLYLEGHGVRQDAARAVELLGSGCANRDADACRQAQALIESGNAPNPARTDAEARLRQACDAGGLRACTALGVAYVTGQLGGSVDAGREILAAACEGGELGACLRLEELGR